MRKLLIFFSAVALFVLSCSRLEGDKSEHLYIISTNDIHATIDALPHLATIVKEYEARGEVLLVDSGDRVTGNAYVDDAREPGVPLVRSYHLSLVTLVTANLLTYVVPVSPSSEYFPSL